MEGGSGELIQLGQTDDFVQGMVQGQRLRPRSVCSLVGCGRVSGAAGLTTLDWLMIQVTPLTTVLTALTFSATVTTITSFCFSSNKKSES